MKKLLFIIFSVLLFPVILFTAYAGNSYDLPELFISVEAPEDWLVMTQDASTNEDAADFLGVGSDTLVDDLKQSYIYINFLKRDISAEIFINMIQEENSEKVISINGYTEKQLDNFAKELMGMNIGDIEEAAEDISFQGVMAEDIEWLDYEIYQHSQVVFIKLHYNKYLDGIAIPTVQYSTIQNGQTINISISSYTGEVSESLEQTGKNIVDSVYFTQVKKGRGPIDLYNIVKTVSIIICIAAIIGLLPFYIKVIKNKKKNSEETPEI